MTEESPRDVYLSACAVIASDPSVSGFRYSRSNPRLTRTRGDWKDIVYFQTRSYNRRGAFVALRIGINVKNRRLQQWRGKHGVRRQDDWVCGSYLGYLTPMPDSRASEWNLAEGSVELVTNEARGMIRDYAIPFFESLTDESSILNLSDERLEVVSPPDAVELLASQNRLEEIAGYLSWLEKIHPLASAVCARRASRLADGDVERTDNPNEQLADVLLSLGIDTSILSK